MVPDAPRRIDEEARRPGAIVEGAPDFKIVVDRDGIGDAKVRQRTTDVVDVLLEGEFGCMHSDNHQALIPVFFGPGADMRE